MKRELQVIYFHEWTKEMHTIAKNICDTELVEGLSEQLPEGVVYSITEENEYNPSVCVTFFQL